MAPPRPRCFAVRGSSTDSRTAGAAPAPNVPAVDPDIRGAVTIRQQLEKHRDQASCAACHARMDPQDSRWRAST